jgi:hypothetical protein
MTAPRLSSAVPGSDIIKLFHEEPFYLEPLPPDDEPDARRRATELGAIDALLPGDFSERPEPHAEDDLSEDALDRPTPYYRIYLAGTDLASGRVGATALRDPGVWVSAIASLFGASRWWQLRDDRVIEIDRTSAEEILTDPSDVAVLVAAHAAPFKEVIMSVARNERRDSVGDLRRLLDDAEAVFLREPAHHGYDWSIFSVAPLRERLEQSLAEHLEEGVRIFVAPYQKARSEERFYFEQWALEELPPWITEVGNAE